MLYLELPANSCQPLIQLENSNNPTVEIKPHPKSPDDLSLKTENQVRLLKARHNLLDVSIFKRFFRSGHIGLP